VNSKRQFKVYLPSDLIEEIRNYAYRELGRFRGALSMFVEQALRQYIVTREHTQIHTNPNPSPKASVVKDQIKEYLKRKYGYVIFTSVPHKHLVEAIASIRGADPRTIRKWIKILEQFKLIKSRGGVWEIL